MGVEGLEIEGEGEEGEGEAFVQDLPHMRNGTKRKEEDMKR